MNKPTKMLAILICVFLLTTISIADNSMGVGPVSGTCGDNLTWQLDEDNGSLIIAGTGTMDDYSAYDGAPWEKRKEQIISITVNAGVTSIGSMAFYCCENLSHVDLPNGLETIGNNAFSCCNSLTRISLPEGLTTIGDYAFSTNHELVSVTMSNTITTIGPMSFLNCYKLKNITFSNNLVTIGYQAFRNCDLGEIVLPDSVREIQNNAFDNSGITTVILPNQLSVMGTGVFTQCSKLASVVWPASMSRIPNNTFGSEGYISNKIQSITLPEGVTAIGIGAFSGCTTLNEIHLPVSLTSIEPNTFNTCSQLTDVYYAGTKAQANIIQMGLNNNYLSTATWHYNTPVIVGDCSQNIHHCHNGKCIYCNMSFPLDDLNVLMLPQSVTRIDEETFIGTAFQALYIPLTCNNIAENAFNNCLDLRYVVLPEEMNNAPINNFGNDVIILFFD